MNWVDWVLGLCYGLGIGSVICGYPLTRTISSLQKTIHLQRNTLDVQGGTIELQQRVLADYEKRFLE